ncbi:MAG: GH32 C-terminal domain-containing protein, partial [Lachnospiraceae bacterium]|nr:GH32 C-terminal domain-containing protein [Candidatus Equihabitans merdae]
NGSLKLRLILDRYSVEIFANDGEQAASFVLYTPLEADGISFHARGSAKLDVEQYVLE